MTDKCELHHNPGWLFWRLQRAAYAAESRALEPDGPSVWAYPVLSTVVHEPASS